MTIGTAYVKIRPDSAGFQRELESSLSKSLRATGASLAATGAVLTRKLTLPILAAGGASVKMSFDFETAMAKIVGLVGVGADEVKSWEGDVRNLAKTYGSSSSEAANALFFITSAGLRGADAINTLEASLKASAVGLGDVATIADLATSAMNAYGSDTLSAGKATDIMVAAVREGKLEASELAGSMGEVLPVASAMGVSFDEVGAAFAALSRTGTDAFKAATQVKGILNSLLKPSADAEKQLAELGLSAGGLREQIREKGLLSTLETLTEAFGDNEEAQARVFGNVRALAGVMDLMGANVDSTRAIFDSMATSTDDTDKAFQVISETGAFQMKQAFSTMKDTLMAFGNIIAPVVTMLAEKLRIVFDWINKLSDSQKKWITIALAVVAAVGPVLVIVGKLISLVGLLISPIGLVVVGIAALVAGFIYAYKNFEGFRNVVDRVAQTVREFVEKAWNKAVEAFNAALPTIRRIAQVVQTVLAKAFEIASDVISKVVPVAIKIIGGFIQAIINIAPKVIDVMGKIVSTVSSAIQKVIEIIRGIVSWVQNNLVPPIAAAIELFIAIWDLIAPKIELAIEVVRAALDVFVGLFKAAFDILGPIIENAVAVFKIAWEVGFGIIKTVVETVFGVIKSTIETVLQVITGIFQTFTGLLTGNFSKTFEGLKNIVLAPFNFIKDNVLRIIRGLITTVEILFNGFITFFTGFPGRVGKALSGLKDAMVNIFKGAIDGIKRLWNATLGKISFTIPGWVPGLAGKSFSFPKFPEFADGGIINSPILGLLGEAGPEVVVPLSRPNRALQLMRETGLDSLVSGGGRGATVNIEQAVFNNGTDANLVAQKVNAAERVRSFGS